MPDINQVFLLGRVAEAPQFIRGSRAPEMLVRVETVETYLDRYGEHVHDRVVTTVHLDAHGTRDAGGVEPGCIAAVTGRLAAGGRVRCSNFIWSRPKRGAQA